MYILVEIMSRLLNMETIMLLIMQTVPVRSMTPNAPAVPTSTTPICNNHYPHLKNPQKISRKAKTQSHV